MPGCVAVMSARYLASQVPGGRCGACAGAEPAQRSRPECRGWFEGEFTDQPSGFGQHGLRHHASHRTELIWFRGNFFTTASIRIAQVELSGAPRSSLFSRGMEDECTGSFPAESCRAVPVSDSADVVIESVTTATVLSKLEKWANYPAIGQPVHPTRFIPCKTPLSSQVLASWSLPEPPRHPLTVPHLLAEQQEQGRTVGLILDLSNVRGRAGGVIRSLNHPHAHAWGMHLCVLS